MRRKDDGTTLLPGHRHEFENGSANGWIEVGGRFIENDQPCIGRKADRQRQFLTHAGRHIGNSARDVKVKMAGEAASFLAINARPHGREEV